MFKKAYILFCIAIIATSCDDNPSGLDLLTDNFDRKEMLEFWAEDIIMPAYENYSIQLKELQDESINFYNDPTSITLSHFQSAWLDAYLVWQEVSMFEIGKAEEIGLRNFTNIYPTNPELIQSNISTGNFNLSLPSNFAAQGFPALDYILFGLDNFDLLLDSSTQEYVKNLIERLITLTSEVTTHWNGGYKSTFLNNAGSSGTASADKIVNDFLYYYEKFLRASKIGMPAGVFSGNVEPDLVEAKYSAQYNKQLFNKGFIAAQNFFNGVSYDGQSQGNSLKQYLNEIHIANNTDFNYSTSIIAQWEIATEKIDDLSGSFEEQISIDNSKMLSVYDELQKAVIILKVDMMQALNIQVDFVDADGD